jgi:chromosome segregation protein
MLVSSQGHVFTATSVSFHAADSEVHGILSRQREIETLFAQHGGAGDELGRLRAAAMSRKTEFEERRTQAEHLRRAVAELQEHHHQLKLDHVRLSQLAERLKARGEQIVRELAEIDAEVAREAAQREEAARQIDALAAGMDALRAGVEIAGEAHANAESALQASRVDAQQIERQHQEAEFQETTISNKIIDIDSSLDVISRNIQRLAGESEVLSTEVSQSDEAPLQAQLQEQLDARMEREQRLKHGRNELQSAEDSLRATEQERWRRSRNWRRCASASTNCASRNRKSGSPKTASPRNWRKPEPMNRSFWRFWKRVRAQASCKARSIASTRTFPRSAP